MKYQHGSDLIDVLGEVYETMLEDVVGRLLKAEEFSAPILHDLIDEVKEETIKLEKVTQEEANKLAETLKQDLNEGAQYLAKTGLEFKDWLGFEVDTLESVALRKLLSVADKTKHPDANFKK